MTYKATFTLDRPKYKIYVDIGYSIALRDQKFIKIYILSIKIKRMVLLILVYRISN